MKLWQSSILQGFGLAIATIYFAAALLIINALIGE